MSTVRPDLEAQRMLRVRSWREGKPQGPVFMEIFPTAACNLDCLFCWRQLFRDASPRQELSDLRLRAVAEEAVALGVQAVCLKGGGEPLLRRDFVEYAAKHFFRAGVFTQLITNGTLFDAKLCGLLVGCRWGDISFSVDGPDAATHDRLRGRSGAFDKIIEAVWVFNKLKKAFAAENPVLTLHCVVTNAVSERIGAMLELAASLEIPEITFDSMAMGAPACPSLALSPEQQTLFLNSIDGWLERAKALGVRCNLERFRAQGGASRATAPRPKTGHPLCYHPWHQLSLREDGSLLPCCVAECREGASRLGDMTLAEAWFLGPMEAARCAMSAGKAPSYCRSCHGLFGHENAHLRAALEAQS
ncbi:MAG: radical SAM protein [Elusimicrobia bacterium]|nr:radical SAM protein [Elusimicrobiota bacterium]